MSNYSQLKNATVLNPTGNVDLGSPTNTYGNIYMSGNLAIGTTTVSSTTIISPRVNSIVYPGDDTAADTAGGQTITLNGAGFVTGASVLIGSTAASVVSVVSSTQISFTSPAMSAGSYVLYIVNPNGATGISIPGLQYSGTPAWSTAAGSLGSQYETSSISNTFVATGDAPIIYSLFSGTLPAGSSLNSGTGLLSGTASATASSTTYNFTIRATDAQNQDTDRAFSLTINPDAVSWSTPADNSTTTAYEYTTITPVTLSATSAAGKSITYTANSLPTGITLSGSSISGTPTTVGSTSTLLTGTATTTNKTATRTVNFVVNQDVVTWSSPADNTTTSAAKDQVMANVTMSATSAAGKSITYTANALPTGLSISGANITGTPTVAANSSSLITATASTTNRTATRTFNWVISVANDTYFKNTTLLLNGETTNTSFISDGSTNSFGLTISGDTKPTLFNPYQGDGYYGAYLNGSSYMTFPNNSAFAFGTGAFTIEFWVNFSLQSDKFFLGGRGAIGTMHITTGGVSTSTTPGALRYVGSSTVTSGSTVITDNAWHHCAIVRDGSTNITVYVDGVSRGTGTDSTNYTTTSGDWWFASNDSGGPSNIPTGYISNFRIVKGTAVYTSAFTPSTTPLTAIANTSILLCQSNRFIDKSTNAFSLTVTGLQISPAIPFTANSSYSTYGSGLFPTDTGADYLRLPASVPGLTFTADFTLEFWVYVTGDEVRQYFGSTTAGKFRLYTNSSGLQLYNNTGTVNITASGAFPASLKNQWVHIAISRTGSNLYYFVNGISKTLTVTAGAVTDTIDFDNQSYIGTYSGIKGFQGYMADFRAVKGTGVYSANFTPPTTPLTAIANTSLLTLQYNGGANNSGIIDNSNFNNIITRNGNASQGSFSPYSQTGWSNYFDGNGDYFSLASTAVLNIESVDFTIEAWINMNTMPTGTSTTGWGGDWNNWFVIYERSNGGTTGWQFRVGATLLTLGGDGDQSICWGTHGMSAGTWYHVAVTRQSGTYKLFVNGTSLSLTTQAVSMATSGTYYIGSEDTSGAYFNGYISNLRVLKGTALYTSTFTPPTTPLTPITNTSLLTCQSNRLIDNSPNNLTITKNGDTSVQAYSPFGSISEATPISYSNYFDGTGDYLTVPNNTALQFGTGDFTVELWWYPTSVASDQGFLGGGYDFAWRTSTGLNIGRINTAWDNTFSFTPTVNQWYHIAYSRSGTSLKVFVNGSQVGSTETNSISYNSGDNGAVIGGSTTSDRPLTGYISNLRLVKGTAVYTSAFTPPTTPLTAIANTSLLTCQSTTIKDNSTNAFTITATGDTKTYKYNPFGYTAQTYTSYTPSIHGGSCYFDGTTDYVTSPASASNIPSGNFTVEIWAYPTSIPAQVGLVGINNTTSSGNSNFGLYIETSRQVTFWVSGNVTTYSTPSAVITIGAWNHVAFVRSGSTNTIYVNGVSVYTNTASPGWGGTPVITVGRLFGDNTGVCFYGYLSDARVTKAAVYTSNFVPPTSPLTSYSTTIPSTLLLNMNNGGIVDQHGSVVLETVGNAQLIPEDPYSGSYYSNYFDGTSATPLTVSAGSSQLSLPGDFTVECWFMETATTKTIPQFAWSTSGGFACGINAYDGGATRKLDWRAVGSAPIYGVTAITTGVWHHASYVKSGNTFRIFLDGKLEYYNASYTTTFTSTSTYIGGNNSDTGYSFVGNISNFRVVKGSVIYSTESTTVGTQVFTPPTSPLTAVTNTALLTCQSNKKIDNSTNALAITSSSTTAVKSMNPFQQNTGKSLYFDGTGDYLTIPSNQLMNFGTGDFTIEAWVYPNSLSTDWFITSASGTGGFFFGFSSSGTIGFGWGRAGTAWDYRVAGNATSGTWQHVAVTRSGSSMRLFVNGTQSGTTQTISTAYDLSTTSTTIGSQGANYYLNGYIDDLRVTKGYARYTSNFTPPTSALITK